MTSAALVLRPEPGNSRTADRLRNCGVTVHQLPLFEVRALTPSLPNEGGWDALLITSVNAIRHGGAALSTLAHLPVVAVGEASAAAARDAGLSVCIVGSRDAAAVVVEARRDGYRRLLHLAGRDRIHLPGCSAVTCYASEPLAVAPGMLPAAPGTVALLHSMRAARRFAELVDRGAGRDRFALAAISAAVAGAAGLGWRSVSVAPAPGDEALVDLAAGLALTGGTPPGISGS